MFQDSDRREEVLQWARFAGWACTTNHDPDGRVTDRFTRPNQAALTCTWTNDRVTRWAGAVLDGDGQVWWIEGDGGLLSVMLDRRRPARAVRFAVVTYLDEPIGVVRVDRGGVIEVRGEHAFMRSMVGYAGRVWDLSVADWDDEVFLLSHACRGLLNHPYALEGGFHCREANPDEAEAILIALFDDRSAPRR